MFSLPQLPDWNALHVLVIHFPLALLMLATPVLLFMALVIPAYSRQLAVAAAVLLLLGTGLCFLALSTGEAAGELAKAQGALEDEEIRTTLNQHAEWATQVSRMFSVLSAAFMIYLLVLLTRKEPLPRTANALILALFLAANLVLALGLGNAAHEGGELVHEHGILAPLAPGAGKAAAAAAAGEGSGYDAYPEHSSVEDHSEHEAEDSPEESSS